jgi:secreted PhoX family phosphatase
MGRSVAGGVGFASFSPFIIGCSSNSKKVSATLAEFPYKYLGQSMADELRVADGLSYQILIKWNDVINNKGEKFGAHCDFLSYLPFNKENPNEGFLWVNHEYFEPMLTSGFLHHQPLEEKTTAQVQEEQKHVGGSLLHIKKDLQTSQWQVVPMSKKNRRFDATTPIPFSGGHKILGSSRALGTLGNCCGGLTPWGTFLTCEENFHAYYGNAVYDDKGLRTVKEAKSALAWDRKIKNPPEHYGWVCEIDPRTSQIVKHPSLGRFAHEGATVALATNNCAVVYMGDDAGDEHFYKFVASTPNQLTEGQLYVAKLSSNPAETENGNGEWMEISLKNPLLKSKFKNHTELMVRVREAAKILGATPLDRPEDCEIDPLTKNIYLACTNNAKYKRYNGYILKVIEDHAQHESLHFKWDVFMKGGTTEMSCPDNLAFDAKGNLWISTDMPEDEKELYGKYGNNSLFLCPTSGDHAGKAIRVAVAPKDAELTGIWFGQDQESLFLSVQHPGSTSTSPEPKDLTSHWPDGGETIPKSSVVVIQGPMISECLKPTVRK